MIDLNRYEPRPTKAGRLFATTDLNRDWQFASADALIEWVKGGAATCPDAGHPLPHDPELPLLYRGQADVNYGFTSSLYRLVRQQRPGPRQVVELADDMRRAEAAILMAVKSEGLGRGLRDIELLALLQHHGVPTRMVDVSYGALEALFFAVNESDARPGRFFAIALNNPYPDSGITNWHNPNVPWGPVDADPNAQHRWNNSVICFPVPPRDEFSPPWAFDARMRAQKGTFLFGGLNDEPPARSIPRQVGLADFADVRSQSITFIGSSHEPASRPATAWSIAVPAAWKEHIRRVLRDKHDLSMDSVYPAVDGMRRLALHVARLSLQRGLPDQ